MIRLWWVDLITWYSGVVYMSLEILYTVPSVFLRTFIYQVRNVAFMNMGMLIGIEEQGMGGVEVFLACTCNQQMIGLEVNFILIHC